MSEFKQVLQRFTSMLLALLMVMTLLPASLLTVYAADTSLSGLADTGIGLTYSDGTWSASGKTITGSVTGKEGGCGSGSSSSGTLTITNNKPELFIEVGVSQTNA